MSKKSPKRAKAVQIAVVLALVTACSGYIGSLASSQNTYTITDGDNVTVYTTTSRDIDQVLLAAGIQVDQQDLVLTQQSGTATYIQIQRNQSVTVRDGDQKLALDTYDATVGQVLEELDISLNDDDTMTCQGQTLNLLDPVEDGMDIAITRNQTEIYTETQTVDYDTETYLDPTMALGETAVKVAGEQGQQEITYRAEYVNGQLVSTEVVSQRLVTPPVTEILLQGSGEQSVSEDETALEIYTEPEPEPESEPEPVETVPESSDTSDDAGNSAGSDSAADAESTEESTSIAGSSATATTVAAQEPANTITTASGQVLRYTSTISVEASAYTGGGTTATGTTARYGAIAVDPTVIPYGTKMYIVSDDGSWIYGEATAEDCGGAIKGNIIDLYFDDYSTCIQFGRRSCTVYILE
jgi:3D (Asp-Asp-Asp) domain-containing protein